MSKKVRATPSRSTAAVTKSYTEVQNRDTKFGLRNVTRHIQRGGDDEESDLPEDLVQSRPSPFKKSQRVTTSKERRRIKKGDASSTDFYADFTEELDSEPMPETLENRYALEQDVQSSAFSAMLKKKGVPIKGDRLYLVEDEDKAKKDAAARPKAAPPSRNARRKHKKKLTAALKQLCDEIPAFPPATGVDDPYFYLPDFKRHVLTARSAVRQTALLLTPKKLEFTGKLGQDAVQLTKGDMLKLLKEEGVFYRWCKKYGADSNRVVCMFETDEPSDDSQLSNSDVLLYIILERTDNDKGKEELQEEEEEQEVMSDSQRVYFITFFYTYVEL